jgi:hypothetical protein
VDREIGVAARRIGVRAQLLLQGEQIALKIIFERPDRDAIALAPPRLPLGQIEIREVGDLRIEVLVGLHGPSEIAPR